MAAKPDPNRIGAALRASLAAAPALAIATTDPTTRVLGAFYGSCLADTTGAVKGGVRDTLRADACFKLTQQYLEPALFNLLLQRLWPADARAQSRLLWTSMMRAAPERGVASPKLSDSTKQKLVAALPGLYVKTTSGVPLLQFLDSIAPAWDRVAAQTDYSALSLSPSNFAQNVVQLQRLGTDSALSSASRSALRKVFATLLHDQYQASTDDSIINLTTSWFVPPRVGGVSDLGGWYGAVGAAFLGHEIAHHFDFLKNDATVQQEGEAFAAEQWRGQLEELDSHLYDDFWGLFIAYDALKQVLQEQPHGPLDGFTPEQRFFLGAAQAVLGGEPERWRIYANGSMSALPAFAQAFACQPGQPMAGGRVWYRAP